MNQIISITKTAEKDIESEQIAQRLRQAMHVRGHNVSQLARKTGLRPSFLYDILSGKSGNPSMIKLARITRALQIRLDDLVEQTPIDLNSLNRTNNTLTTIPGWGNNPAQNKHNISVCKQWLNEQLQRPLASLYHISMPSDCMQTTLQRDDCLFIDSSDRIPSPPGIFLLNDGMGPTIRRIECINGNQVLVRADNPLYASYQLPREGLPIIGRVVWYGRTL